MTEPERARPVAAKRSPLAGEAAGGVVLIAATLLALLAANLPATAGAYRRVLDHAAGPMTIRAWVDDGLMAVFFLTVGLEITRALTTGGPADPAGRRLPFVAAAAGMIVPALVYLAVAGSVPGSVSGLARGWAIPAATDIAFAVGIVALLGSRVPPPLKLFLTAVAIVDDMGAIAIIALVYAHGIDLGALAGVAGVAAAMLAANRAGVRRRWPYLVGFALLWVLMLRSGVHATVAGVIAAMLVPADGAASPAEVLEHRLAPWSAFAIVPLFAFANAGVDLRGVGIATIAQPLVLAIAGGLFLGKQAGIAGAIRLAERTGFAPRPGGAPWRQVHGVALLCGIGFTMSLFIGGLAFPDDPLLAQQVKLGVLGGSLLSAVAGYLLLRFSSPEPS